MVEYVTDTVHHGQKRNAVMRDVPKRLSKEESVGNMGQSFTQEEEEDVQCSTEGYTLQGGVCQRHGAKVKICSKY